jgi:hypothetical protein
MQLSKQKRLGQRVKFLEREADGMQKDLARPLETVAEPSEVLRTRISLAFTTDELEKRRAQLVKLNKKLKK